jgi:hypothetical protein
MNIDDIYNGIIEYYNSNGIKFTERDKKEMKRQFDRLIKTLKEMLVKEYKKRTKDSRDIKPIVEKVIDKNIECINEWVRSILCPDVFDRKKAWIDTINIADKLIYEVIKEAKE